jgi:hypothetical protein
MFNKAFQSSTYNWSKKYSSSGSGPASNQLSGHVSRPTGQVQLHSGSKNEPAIERKSIGERGATRNTCEEGVLGDDGITKTVETSVDVESYRDEESARVTEIPFRRK